MIWEDYIVYPQSQKEAETYISKFAKNNILPTITKRFLNLNKDNCIAILHGGYAIEKYTPKYITSDIDIKIIQWR